tara:strand:+ start:6360 stop:8333 length:1974 start_codon:yes stop_codon:yes gene_type:complete
MKFLNHPVFNEHELRKAKMYRISSAAYTPAVSSAGNIIYDTSAGIPKWWDGSQWRDFSFGTTGTMNWIIQSDSGSNIQVDNGETLDIAGGTLLSTVTSGSATAPVVTINHNSVSRTNTSATKTFNSGATDTLAVISSITTSSEGHVTDVETTTVSNPRDLYNIGAEDSTSSPTGEAMIVLQKTINGTTTTADQVRMRDGTYVEATVINAGTIDFDLSAVDGTSDNTDRFLTKDNKWAVPSYTVNSNTTFTLPTTNGANPDLVLTASNGNTDVVNMNGTANEVEVVGSGTNTLTFGLPDDVTIGNDLTVTTDASIGNDLTVVGNLTVQGTTTTLDTTNTNIKDNVIQLNSGASSALTGTSGIEIERGSNLPHPKFLWNDSTHVWTVDDGNGTLTTRNVIQNIFSTVAGNTGSGSANSISTTLTIQGSNGISTSVSGQTLTIDGSGVSNQDLYKTFTGDSGSTTANSPTDTLDIEGGTGISTTATTDKVTVNFDIDTSGLLLFKNVRPRNTNNAGTVTNGTTAVADNVADTLDIKTADESIVVSGGDDFISFKGAVKCVAVDIDVSSLSELNQAHINHGFGTKDLIVQLWQKTGGGKNENVTAKIEHINSSGNASINDITITFDYVGLDADIADGDADVRCIIMACNHITAAGATVTYS